MIKEIAGRATTLISPQCRFDRAIFILGHMRCGSTALSHILCSHPEISGYGEAHVHYDGRDALGVLTLNQLRRHALRPRARYLFDKVLHSRYDAGPHPEFFRARAIFLVREPAATIRSIRNLFRTIGSGEYASDGLAADYYEERLARLIRNWDMFPPKQRMGFTYERLTSNPEAAISAISAFLELSPPLANRYAAPAKTMAHGSGDPLASHKFKGIVENSQATTLGGTDRPLEIPSSRIARLHDLYEAAFHIVTQM